MHRSAEQLGRAFFEIYWQKSFRRILDVGALDINGSLRAFRPSGAEYVGVDLTAGNGVDVVLEDPHQLPFPDDSFDVAVSTSCLEHDSMFWLTVLEMARVVGKEGFLYVNAPSNGRVHRRPADYWRFYPDAAWALADWSARNGRPLWPVESFVCGQVDDVWNDCVMVFSRQPRRPERYLSSAVRSAHNVYRGNRDALESFSPDTEDMATIAQLRAALAEREAEVATLRASASWRLTEPLRRVKRRLCSAGR
jgi:SAM-dependent methyltransferase